MTAIEDRLSALFGATDATNRAARLAISNWQRRLPTTAASPDASSHGDIRRGTQVEIVPESRGHGARVGARNACVIDDRSPTRQVDATAGDALPAWAEQKRAGRHDRARFGFAGRAEVRERRGQRPAALPRLGELRLRHQLAVLGQIARRGRVADRLRRAHRPGMSNAALAWDNILNNAEWQHGDVWLKLLQTIVMAFVGTVFAAPARLPAGLPRGAQHHAEPHRSTRSPSGSSTSCARSTC